MALEVIMVGLGFITLISVVVALIITTLQFKSFARIINGKIEDNVVNGMDKYIFNHNIKMTEQMRKQETLMIQKDQLERIISLLTSAFKTLKDEERVQSEFFFKRSTFYMTEMVDNIKKEIVK